MKRTMTLMASLALANALAANTLECSGGGTMTVDTKAVIKGLGPLYVVSITVSPNPKQPLKLVQAKLRWQGYGQTFELDSKTTKSKPVFKGNTINWRVYTNYGAATKATGSLWLKSQSCKGWVAFSSETAIDLP